MHESRILIRRRLRGFARILKLLSRFLRGYRDFRRTGSTSAQAYRSMRELYWRTNGRFNDSMAFFVGLQNRPYTVDHRRSQLGMIDEYSVKAAVRDLRSRGYHVFKHRLPEDAIVELTTFAKTAPSRPLVSSSQNLTSFTFEHGDPVVFDGANPLHVLYRFDEGQVMETRAAQQILTEPWLLSLAQDYLRCKPVNDMVTMWWSTSVADKPSSEAAQFYHFDMDWIKFVKFFVYLTDVQKDTGPHSYVAGSHRRKPAALLRDGRFRDEELKDHYPPDDLVEITGPPGTMFIADTRGFHKGKHPIAGNRLVLQIEFAINLFGQSYPVLELNDAFTPEFIQTAKRYPYTYTRFISTPREERTPVRQKH